MTHSHLLREWRAFFGSLSKALEILAVWEGVKPAVRMLVFQNDAPRVKAFLESLPLAVETASFKVRLDDAQGNGAYSSRGSLMPLSQGVGYHVLYVARDQALAREAMAAENRADHVQLGHLLGYPSCCTRFFAEYSTQESSRRNTFVRPLLAHSRTLKQAEVYPFQNNVFLRDIDVCLLSHIPCSLDCERSREQGKNMLVLLHKYSSETARFFEDRLRGTLLVSDEQHELPLIALAQARPVSAEVTTFTQAIAPRQNDLVESLNKARMVEVLAQGGILVADRIHPEYTLVRFG